MANALTNRWQWRALRGGSRTGATSISKRTGAGAATFPLRLAREGDWVTIVSVNGGKDFHDRLAGVGLRIGVTLRVWRNSMNGRLLIGHGGTRLYIGGGMAHKISVAAAEGA